MADLKTFVAGTYVQLSREEFEDWLNDEGYRGKWRIKPGRGGIYQIRLSDSVGIEINSTTGSGSEVMTRGAASMKCKLISLVTGRTLNKKAMGQSHFKRTVNWRQTWAKGLKRLKDAYVKSKDWYDTIAAIEDRDQYKQDMLALIESKTNWNTDRFLIDLHKKVSDGGVLTQRQIAAVERMGAAPSETHDRMPSDDRGMRDAPGSAQGQEWKDRIEAIPGWEENGFLSSIWSWVVEKGRDLTPKQEAALEKFEANARRPEPRRQQGPSVDDLLADLRRLWQVAEGADKAWIAEFGKRVKRERSWSQQDGQHVDRLMQRYRGRRASTESLVDRLAALYVS